mgnify:CR=1 FL=1
MTDKRLLIAVAAWVVVMSVNAQSVREKILLDDGWKFAFGHAADPVKDFGCGTEYFNYLTKANSIHNEGPYSLKFIDKQSDRSASDGMLSQDDKKAERDDSDWLTVTVPHDWVTTLPYAPDASHSHGYKHPRLLRILERRGLVPEVVVD